LCFGFAEKVLDETRANCIIDFASVGLIRGAFDLVAKQRGIPYLWQTETRLKDRFLIETRATPTYKDVYRRYEELLSCEFPCKKGEELLQEFRESNQASYSHFLPLKVSGDSLLKVFAPKNIVNFFKKMLKFPFSLIKEVRLRYRAIKDPLYRYNWQFYKGVVSTTIRKKMCFWYEF